MLAGLVGMSASWLKGIERGTRLPPRLPLLVKLAEALAVGDVAVLAGTDMDLGGAASVPVASFARIPHDAVPAIREAIRDPLLTVPAGPADVAALAARTADAWLLWHRSTQHRTDVGRILPRLVTDAWRHWDAASAMAGRLPGGYHHPWTMFGRSNVKLHAVSIAADLSRSAEVRSHAEDIDPEEIPSRERRERRGRLGVEIARSYHQRRDYPAMLHWLETAYQTSADSVCYSPAARQMTADAVDHGGALISRRARSLAGSVGLPQ